MTDNVIPFRKRHGSDEPNKRLIIELGQWASHALDRRVAAEDVNKSTALNRSILLYDDLMTVAGSLAPGEYTGLWLSQFPDDQFMVVKLKPKSRRFQWPWQQDKSEGS
ncbi:MAG: hypothetical protein NVS3B29_03640 [Candidatus Saccharimonadales bacterium]